MQGLSLREIEAEIRRLDPALDDPNDAGFPDCRGIAGGSFLPARTATQILC